MLYCLNANDIPNPDVLNIGQKLIWHTDYTQAEKERARLIARLFTPDKVSSLEICPEVVRPTDVQPIPKHKVKPKVKPAPTPEATPVADLTPERGGLYLGVGWPDVKLRYGFESAPVDLEAKVAFGTGIQVYSGRLYWTYYSFPVSPLTLNLTTGLEGGYMALKNDDGISDGGGHDGLVFAGVEAPLGHWGLLSVDIGPGYISEYAGSQTVTSLQWVVTTGFYVRLF